jgi:sensor histidine kinase YesM
VPIVRSDRPRALLIHLAGALTFAAAHTVALALHASYQRGTLADIGVLFSKFSSPLAVDMMMYAAIVGASHAMRFHREARARELAASQLEASLTEARLVALRGQLNPHFLFNTLNAISTMALKGEHENVVRTLGYLGELLRVSLDDDLPQEVPRGDELEFLERYLDIQRSRFGDRLTIRQEVAPDAIEALVPSMILQPFVENAVTHGIAETPGPGEISIRAARRGGSLVIEVADSGPGPAASAFDRPRRGGRSGVGLANTRARLVQLYGDAHTLTLGSAGGRGACASVTIPYRLAPRVAPRAAS